LKTIRYEHGWTYSSLAEEALRLVFPLEKDLKICAVVVQELQGEFEYTFPHYHTRIATLVAVTLTVPKKEIGTVVTLITVLPIEKDEVEPQYWEKLPVEIEVRTLVGKEDGNPYRSVCFSIRSAT